MDRTPRPLPARPLPVPRMLHWRSPCAQIRPAPLGQSRRHIAARPVPWPV
ncbi:hypothetical protein [Lactococcus petauri]|nr:hypothetical protein [Lactococcus petauri]